MAEHCIVNSYKKWNFNDKQRQRLIDLDKDVLKSRQKQDRLVKQMNKLDNKLSSLRKEESNCWDKAGKMLERLEKRCKHNGDTYKTQRYRDFGCDVIRTHCSQCGKIIAERDKDC